MSEKTKTHKVGEVVKAKTVTRPDGEEVTVSGGHYVLMQPGTYVIDDEEMEVR